MRGEVVTVVRDAAVLVDTYGDPIEGAVVRTSIPNVAVRPRTSSESSEPGRFGLIVGLTAYFPPGSDVVRTDRVEVRGDIYAVEGEVGDWRNPFTGEAKGLEVALRRAEG